MQTNKRTNEKRDRSTDARTEMGHVPEDNSQIFIVEYTINTHDRFDDGENVMRDLAVSEAISAREVTQVIDALWEQTAE